MPTSPYIIYQTFFFESATAYTGDISRAVEQVKWLKRKNLFVRQDL